jgi:opacity protein-like surface antigen
MRLFLSVCLAAMACAGSARAADMPKKAADTPVAPAANDVSWSGCYLGAHIGGAWGGEHWSNPQGFALSNGAPLFSGTADIPLVQGISGGLVGGQAGCRYQVLPQLVIGAVGDYSHAAIQREDSLSPFVSPPGVGIPTVVRTHTDHLASAGGMLGFPVQRLLVYGKGGAAWARNTHEINAIPAALLADSDLRAADWRTGWFAGGGIEYAITPSLSTFFEFDYYDFGTRTLPFTDQAGAVSTMDLRQRLNAVKFGLNYKFLDFDGGSVKPLPPPGPILSTGDWVQTFQTETRYFSWKSSRGVPTNALTGSQGNPQPNTAPGSGTEIYIPYAWQLVGQPGDVKVEVLGRGGWVRARQTTSGVEGQVSTMTDTVASATFTYLGFTGVQPFAALEMNLPTGRAAIPGNTNARMDPDLVDVASFGEGLNFGPSVGVNIPVNDNFIIATSVGYTRRGAFTRESTITPTGVSGLVIPAIIDPGNVFTVTASAGFKIENFTGKVTGTYSTENETKQNNQPFVRPGHRYLVAASGSYAWPYAHAGVTTLNFNFAHANLNEVLFVYTGAPTNLLTEPFNTNSNLYQSTLEHLFVWDQFAAGPTGSFLFRDNNGYNQTTLQFVPAKQRWSAGAIAKYAPNSTVTFNARAERIWTSENENPAIGDGKFSVLAQSNGLAFTVPVVSSTGWQFVVGASARF